MIKIFGYVSIVITAFVATITFLGKKLVDWYLQRETNKFQSQLDENLKIFDAGLKDSSIKYQITFANLHNKRAEIIVEIYELIVNLEMSSRKYLTYSRPYDVLEDAFLTDFNLLEKRHFQTEIYFTDLINEKITSIIKTGFDIWDNYNNHLHFSDSILIEQTKEKLFFLNRAYESLNQKIPLLKTELRQEYRKILGVE